MQTIWHNSPLGRILLAADAQGITGLWFEGQSRFARGLAEDGKPDGAPALEAACRYLQDYFAGRAPQMAVPLHLVGTPFEREVWQLLLQIPYGRTTTYGRLAAQLAARRGVARMSAQAVGGAVGRNRISLLIPCHRVLGADGRLTGYAGGLSRKAALLALEQKGRL